MIPSAPNPQSYDSVILSFGKGWSILCPFAFIVFYTLGRDLILPDYAALAQTTTPKGLQGLLTTHAGISENIHEPPPGQTRRPLTANIRHALFYCFQQQSEIIGNVQKCLHGLIFD